VVDELEGSVHRKYLQALSQETVTIRHGINDTAVPYRQMGSFKPGTGVGGAGSHWSGCHFRALPEDFKVRSNVEQRYGKKFIPQDMTHPGFPGLAMKTWKPHFDHFEYVCGTSGKAGVINGKVIEGGNPFEGSRSREFPLGRIRTTSAPRCSTRRSGDGLPPVSDSGVERLGAVRQPLRLPDGAVQRLRLLQ
jgi:gluconate 2-dehydrogenase alpha chain